MKRNAVFTLTPKDIEAVKGSILDDRQGIVRRNGSW